ncbi:Methylenetetrahydrofolate reductase [Neofusicoccum parvum]|uniref:Methylenetetrahydrofolate reductase n=2 Tax=Neofusicoccum parvum TaxID=310453 RepID=A0ACB5RZH2_9PEZI|nr:putative methylenetetrahydrofolate reductase protein [Neofusicoccum parvum UCRNP2]GME25914.1 Methylenetetrahydrofolate reductase [Neofusicoccum parvum]GME65852.1 Methylenetetrahydrofolate reductase [Neofusicoccum parvum]
MEKITDKLAALPQDGRYFSLEFFPPKTQMGFANLQNRLERMASALRPLFVTVTWGAGGSTASKSLELAELTQRQLGLTTCLHLTCTNMSRALVDDALEQAKALGVRNILALRGDPPRSDEYREGEADQDNDSNKDFTWAADLVRYIRKQYGDYFCIGVAAYPEGHSDQSHPDKQDPKFDLPYLIEKTKAGADFIMTQLFFDIHAYEDFENMLRNDPSGVFKTIPIVPGLMPIQSYQILRRTTKLSHAKLPPDMLARLDTVKGDDEAVKNVGVDILSEIIEEIKKRPSPGPRGFHFYTLNLEKAVAHIVERCRLILSVAPDESVEEAVTIDDIPVNGGGPTDSLKVKDRRRLSSANSTPHNRVVVDRPSTSSNKSYEALADEAGVPKDKIMTRANTLAISEGEGSLGREATWDDFPNGRWGDARSPAYGEIDGYGVSLHVSIPQAIRLWKYPTTVEDISDIFRRHILGELEAIPWSEEGLNAETETIRDQLLKLIGKGWWSVASQPAVNGVKSTDAIFGWGPKNGYVFQKPFVEFFLSSADWKKLQAKLDELSDVTYFAGTNGGDFSSNDEDSVNPVTWGSFAGKEIVTPTIIESVSFRAWLEEAFSIWSEWRHIYPPRSATASLLGRIRDDYWLVNIIHHDFVEKDALWRLLLED